MLEHADREKVLVLMMTRSQREAVSCFDKALLYIQDD